ncbi:MAG: hypothetical protein ILO68_00980 [Clostridia bacterium]|nr:hypothetical protein [Clostridia bacterium]
MFGYIRPVRRELLVKDDELYGALYCGLCRYSGKHVTHLARFVLNYDFTFLAVLRLSLTGEPFQTRKIRCPYKLRKKETVVCEDAYRVTASHFGILTYYKLLDDVRDEKGWKRAGARLLLPFARRMRKKAVRLGASEDLVRESIQNLQEVERLRSASPDEAADCFAKLTSGLVSSGLSGAEERIARRCGYHIGRFVYLIDALDDLEKDEKSGSYNPFLVQYGTAENAASHAEDVAVTLNDSMRAFSRDYALHCGADLTSLDRILFNISDLGGPAAVQRVLRSAKLSDNKESKDND